MSTLIVRVFEQIGNEPQKGELVNPITELKIDDCVIDFTENRQILKEGDYSYDLFERVYIAADFYTDKVPEKESLDYILLKLK